MSEQVGMPTLTRFPELQPIREAQNQMLLDPNFLRSASASFGLVGQPSQQPLPNQPVKDSMLQRMLGGTGIPQHAARPMPWQDTSRFQQGGKV